MRVLFGRESLSTYLVLLLFCLFNATPFSILSTFYHAPCSITVLGRLTKSLL